MSTRPERAKREFIPKCQDVWDARNAEVHGADILADIDVIVHIAENGGDTAAWEVAFLRHYGVRLITCQARNLAMTDTRVVNVLNIAVNEMPLQRPRFR